MNKETMLSVCMRLIKRENVAPVHAILNIMVQTVEQIKKGNNYMIRGADLYYECR